MRAPLSMVPCADLDQIMFTWKFRKVSDMGAIDRTMVKAIHDVFLDGFGEEEGWSADGIETMFKRSMVLGLLTTDTDGIVGYAFYAIPELPFMGSHMLWENAICLKKFAQGSRNTSRIWYRASALYPGRTFGWIGGRTQNPLIMSRYKKLGYLFPFETAYNEGDGRLVMEYLLANIEEVSSAPPLDKSNGICRRKYKGRLGDYKLGIEGTEKLEAKLSAWEFDRDKGDAVIIVSRLCKPIQVSASIRT